MNNVVNVSDTITDCLLSFRTYMNELDKEIIAVICVCIPALVILLAWYTIKKINEQKIMIYKCIISLPKNVVWKIADSFKVLKKDTETRTTKSHDEDFNKQEENMIKIFVTSSDNNGKAHSDTVSIIVSSVLVVIIFIAFAVIDLLYIGKITDIMCYNSPHIDNLMGAYTYDLASMIFVFCIGAHEKDFKIPGFEVDYMLMMFRKWQAEGIADYKAYRYGNPSWGIKPFEGALDIAHNQDSVYNCSFSDKHPPTDFHEIYRCWNGDLVASYVQLLVADILESYDSDRIKFQLDLKTDKFAQVWHIHQIHLYNNFFALMYEQIAKIIIKLMSKETPFIIGLALATAVVAVIIGSTLSVEIYNSEKKQKFALSLLLHCPSSVVIANSNIMTILSGNFDSNKIGLANRDEEFYNEVVNNLPDAILTINHEFTIKTANKSIKRIFKKNGEELVGTQLSEFGNIFAENPFDNLNDLQERSTFDCNSQIENSDGTVTNYSVKMTALPDVYVATFRDITQSVMYNQLISDECQKVDSLLSSILPPKLVPRVQAGETNISFSVQSATILFLDIVSFTPWCCANDAAYVMKTLNRMFKDFDFILSQHPTMTKIKCIGDCYMAAGGIFMDINQPAVHAKDVVEFGLETINALEKINEEFGEKLQIRVGINTGGPLVAGVLGTGKPTFEILGPAINVAQQMEHHGVPMKVHISRSTYELIYGGNFEVKERGEIEIKQGTTVTYIVSK